MQPKLHELVFMRYMMLAFVLVSAGVAATRSYEPGVQRPRQSERYSFPVPLLASEKAHSRFAEGWSATQSEMLGDAFAFTEAVLRQSEEKSWRKLRLLLSVRVAAQDDAELIKLGLPEPPALVWDAYVQTLICPPKVVDQHGANFFALPRMLAYGIYHAEFDNRPTFSPEERYQVEKAAHQYEAEFCAGAVKWIEARRWSSPGLAKAWCKYLRVGEKQAQELSLNYEQLRQAYLFRKAMREGRYKLKVTADESDLLLGLEDAVANFSANQKLQEATDVTLISMIGLILNLHSNKFESLSERKLFPEINFKLWLSTINQLKTSLMDLPDEHDKALRELMDLSI